MRKPVIFIFIALFCILFLLEANIVRVPIFISQREAKLTINATADSLEKYYVDPAIGKEMASALREGMANGKFDNKNPGILGSQVKDLLRNICHDKHIDFFYGPKFSEDLRKSTGADIDSIFFKAERNSNFYIHPLQIINNNIGYIRLDQLVEPAHAGNIIDNKLDSLIRTRAIIVDLRYNKGGDPTMVQRIISHFYKSDTLVHLNDIYCRRSDKITQYWTLREFNGKRTPQMPLYILTSRRTASAAEELAYDLKCLHRAIVVGEATSGGAHPGNLVAVGDRFVMFLPDSNPINPYTHTNWERTGVAPDVAVPENLALEKAQELINTQKGAQ